MSDKTNMSEQNKDNKMQISVESYMVHHYPSLKHLPNLMKKVLFGGLKKLFHEEQINAFIAENEHKDTFGYIEEVLEYFDITTTMKSQELANIPSYGKVVIVANHPLGALDAIALLHMVKSVRTDIKIVANSFLTQLKGINDILIPIDNINAKMEPESTQQIYDALQKQKAVIIFPSGEVSRAKPHGIKDGIWKSGFLKMAIKAEAPILPIYIKATNSKNFYLLSMINRNLATATLPHEMFKAKGKEIKFTIGKIIPFSSYHMPHLTKKEGVKLLRKHFYRVATNKRGIFKTHNEISTPEKPSEVKQALKEGTFLGETSDGKHIVFYESSQEDTIIKEIGRLREISFRQVGEGSGHKRDIDSYDLYYKHLIIWDDDNLEIAGAYRFGDSEEIVETFGIEGLYTSTLFSYDKKFTPYFEQGLELGRSFVQPKYWNSRALDYLWQGLGAYVKGRRDIKYLFGAVSLSDLFTPKAKGLIIYFYAHYFKAKHKLVSHNDPYTMPSDIEAYCKEVFDGNDYKADQRTLKSELSLLGFTIPTLYKQYAELSEEEGGVVFFDFGFDADFNDCIDGFIMVDLTLLKESKRKRYFGED